MSFEQGILARFRAKALPFEYQGERCYLRQLSLGDWQSLVTGELASRDDPEMAIKGALRVVHLCLTDETGEDRISDEALTQLPFEFVQAVAEEVVNRMQAGMKKKVYSESTPNSNSVSA